MKGDSTVASLITSKNYPQAKRLFIIISVSAYGLGSKVQFTMLLLIVEWWEQFSILLFSHPVVQCF